MKHGPSEILLEVTIPGDYPKKHCHIKLSSNQELHPDVIALGNEAIRGYWDPSMLGQLMFRPFIRWWDKNMVKLLQSPMIAQATASKETVKCEDDKDIESEDEEPVQPLANFKKGTEMRFSGLELSEILGTAFWTNIRLVLSCMRCKNNHEVDIKEERLDVILLNLFIV